MHTEPLRILVIGNLPPYVLGGAENQVARLVEGWLNAGAVVEVAGTRIPDGYIELGGHRVRTHRLRGASLHGRMQRAVAFATSLSRLAWKRRTYFDVIYCRGLADAAVTLSLLKCLGGWLRSAIVVCPINAKGNGDVAFLRSIPLWKALIRCIDRQVAAFCIINRFIPQELDRIGITRPIRHMIPNGVVAYPDFARRDLDQEPILMVWSGRFEKQKGLDLLIPLIAKVAATSPSFELALYGDGSLRGELELQVAAFDLKDKVHFMGTLGANELRERLLHADIFILPSRYEGMSNAALEAMEAGLPVLCTRCGGVDCLIDPSNGWVAEPGDIESLEHALRSALATPRPALRTMGDRARAYVLENLSMQQIAQRNLLVFEQASRKSA